MPPVPVTPENITIDPEQVAAIERQLPADFDQRRARLPETYRSAQRALAKAEKIDEVVKWKSQAEAIRSYAAQVRDGTLEAYAKRIRLRAIRRLGELLKEYDARGAHRKKGAAPLSRREVAAKAGVSADQQKAAVKIAALPKKQFDDAVERANPPTVTDLTLKAAKRVRTTPRDGTAAVNAAIPAEKVRIYLEHLRHLARITGGVDLEAVAKEIGGEHAALYDVALEGISKLIALRNRARETVH